MRQVHAYSSENSTRFLTELTSIYIERKQQEIYQRKLCVDALILNKMINVEVVYRPALITKMTLHRMCYETDMYYGSM